VKPWKVTAVLAVLGAIAGGAAAIPLTFFGKIISGAPNPATLHEYAWNIRVLAVMGAVFSPVFAWGALRHVPIWRAVVEPALAAIAGSIVSMLVMPALFPFTASGPAVASTHLLSKRYENRRPVP